MSLKDARVKMSKSSKADYSRINLLDPPELIHSKITKAKTDSIATLLLDESRPEITNLMRIFAAIQETQPADIQTKFQDATIMQFKEGLSQALIEKLSPIREKVESK